MMEDDQGHAPEFTLCLCGRNPNTAELRAEAAKAIALSLRYGLVMDGCLWQAAAAYDEIYIAVTPGEARKLDALRAEVTNDLNNTDLRSWREPAPNPARVH